MAAPKQYGNRILVVGGIGIFSVGTYIALKLREQAQAHPLINALQIKPGNMFDDFADDYDNSCRLPEFALGINWMRWWLLRKAKVYIHATYTFIMLRTHSPACIEIEKYTPTGSRARGCSRYRSQLAVLPTQAGAQPHPPRLFCCHAPQRRAQGEGRCSVSRMPARQCPCTIVC